MLEICDVCATFARQLVDIELRIEEMTDRRGGFAQPQEEPQISAAVRDLEAEFHRTLALYNLHRQKAPEHRVHTTLKSS